MTKKLRIAHVIVQPVFVYDDGEELEPGPVASPVQVPLKALSGLADRFRAEVEAAESASDSDSI